MSNILVHVAYKYIRNKFNRPDDLLIKYVLQEDSLYFLFICMEGPPLLRVFRANTRINGIKPMHQNSQL